MKISYAAILSTKHMSMYFRASRNPTFLWPLLIIPMQAICAASLSEELFHITESSTQFPRGTILLSRDKKTHTLLWSSQLKLHNSRTGAEYTYPKPESGCDKIVWSAEGKYLLVIGKKASILAAETLKLVRRLPTAKAWWNGSHYEYLEVKEKSLNITSSSGKKVRVPPNLVLCGIDPESGYILARINLHHKGNQQNGPVSIMQLWKLDTNERLKLIHNLGKTNFDPGGSGSASTFGSYGGKRDILGEPQSDAYDILQISNGGRITPLIAGKQTIRSGNIRGLCTQITPYLAY